MASQWTGSMIKQCAAAYSTDGIKAAMALTGKTASAIRTRMCLIGVPSNTATSENLIITERKWYAEDVANLMEMIESGVKHSIAAEYYDVKIRQIQKVLYLARKHGFAAYPMRNKS